MGFTSGRHAGIMVALCLAIGASAAAAQETLGEIEATIDSEAYEWRTLGGGGSDVEYNTDLRDFGPVQTISMMGFPPGDVSMRGTIQLIVGLGSDTLTPVDQEVIYAPEGMSRMWMSIEGEDLVTVESFETTDDGGEVAGTFSGRVCFKESMFAEPDPDNCKPIEGRFSSRLPLSEF